MVKEAHSLTFPYVPHYTCRALACTLVVVDVLHATCGALRLTAGHDFSRLLHTGLEHAGVPTKLANKVPVVNFKNGAGWMFECVNLSLVAILQSCNPATL